MTAFHSMMLLSVGAPLTPAGGSSCSLGEGGRGGGKEHKASLKAGNTVILSSWDTFVVWTNFGTYWRYLT